MQLTYDQLMSIMGQYDSEGGRSLPPDIAQWLASQPYAEQPSMMGGGADRVYDFQQYDNQFGSAPVGPNGQPMFEPAEGWGGGMQSLRNAALVLGGTAAFGNLAMPYLAGGGGAAATGGAAAAGGGEAAALAAAENGILGSTVGMGAGAAVPAAAAAAVPAAAATTGLGSALGGIGSALAGNPGLAAAGIGALAGLADSGDETKTSTQGLPAWMQPSAERFLSRAESLSNAPYTPYTGEGVAGLNGDQATAFNLVRQQANTGDPLVNQARGQQSNVIQGGMLNSNPYLDQVARGIGDRMGEAYATGTRGSLTSNAQLSGNDPRYSSAYQQTVGNADRAFGDSLGQTMSTLYGNNYNAERGAQDAASRASLGFSTDAMRANEGLLNVGNQIQGQQQNVNNFNYQQFQNQQAYPQQQLGVLSGALQGNFGQTSTATQPGVGTAQSLLGGALSGAGLYNYGSRAGLWGAPSAPPNAMNMGASNGSSSLDNYFRQFN